MEHEEGSGDEAAEGHGMVPAEMISKVVDGEDAKNGEGDDLLDDLELVRGEGA